MDQFRPTTWNDMIGQEQMKERLDLHMVGSLMHDEAMPHVLLAGPPGSGKTTIASLIAGCINYDFASYIAPPTPKVLKRIVRESYKTVVLFDEIHRWTQKQQEELLPLLEDGYIQTPNGMKIESNMLTIVGATTEPDKVIPPLYDRFTIRPPFEDYTDDEMATILTNMGRSIGVEFAHEEAVQLGRATGGVPRNCKMIALVARDSESTDPATILDILKLTEDGLTQEHVEYLNILQDAGGQAGLQILAAHLQMPKAAIVNLERLLLKREFIEYEPQGRVLTGKAFHALKKIG